MDEVTAQADGLLGGCSASYLKSAGGMAEYGMRSWGGWHQHMAMVMLALLFILRERTLVAEELEGIL